MQKTGPHELQIRNNSWIFFVVAFLSLLHNLYDIDCSQTISINQSITLLMCQIHSSRG